MTLKYVNYFIMTNEAVEAFIFVTNFVKSLNFSKILLKHEIFIPISDPEVLSVLFFFFFTVLPFSHTGERSQNKSIETS